MSEPDTVPVTEPPAEGGGAPSPAQGSPPAAAAISPSSEDAGPETSEARAEGGSDSLDHHLVALNRLLVLLIFVLLAFHPYVIKVVGQLQEMAPLLVLVLCFTYVAYPMVRGMHAVLTRLQPGTHVSHERSLLLSYVVLLSVATLSIGLVVPNLLRETKVLADNLPGYSAALKSTLSSYQLQYGHLLPPGLQVQASEAAAQAGSLAGEMLQRGLAYLNTISQMVVWVAGAIVMVPLLGYYFLADGMLFHDEMLKLVPARNRRTVRHIVGEIHIAMQSFVKGQAILCLCMGIVSTIGVAFVLPQFAIGLGIVAGITEAIPVIGPILGAIPAIVIAWASKGTASALTVACIYTALQQLESVVLVPRVMGESLGLHPLSLMLGAMVFGSVLGFWGVVLAAPLVATVKILVTHLLHDAPDPQIEHLLGQQADAGLAGSEAS